MRSNLANNVVAAIFVAQSAGKPVITFASSRLVISVLNVLCREGLIFGFVINKKNSKFLDIYLKYVESEPIIQKVSFLNQKNF